MATYHELTTVQLRQALQLREQIETLQQKLDSVLLGDRKPAPGIEPKKKGGRSAGKRTMSAEGRAKIAAAQKARWAKVKGTAVKSARAAKPAATAKKKGGLTAEGRAKLAASMKARWEDRKKAAPATHTPEE